MDKEPEFFYCHIWQDEEGNIVDIKLTYDNPFEEIDKPFEEDE